MSIECSNVIWNRNFSGSSRKMVAVKLADPADDEGRGIWPSVEKIAAKCDLSCRTVQRVLSDFVKEGILKVVSEGGNGPRDTRRYDFDMAIVRALPLAVAPPDRKGDTPSSTENKGDTVSPLENDKGDTDDAKGDTDDKKGCHGVTQTVNEPPIKPSLERARERDGEEKDHGKVGERAFKRAFAGWPTFVSDSEPAARKAWDALATDERLQAVERLGAYIASVKAAGRSKFCAFGVYLSQKRWEKLADAPVAPVRAAAPAFGPAWAGLAMAHLLAGPVDLGPPAVTAESRRATYALMVQSRGLEWAQAFYRRQGCDFDAAANLVLPEDFDDQQWRLHRLKNGWPEVNRMHEAAQSGHGLKGADAARGTRLAPLMEFVPADMPRFAAWQALFAARGWPWRPPVGRMTGIYFPACGPDDLAEFEKAALSDDHAETSGE